MSQTQQETIPSEGLPVAKQSELSVESQTGSWEPYLSLINDWQRADEICAKAIARAHSTRQEEENRALSMFESDKAKLESDHRDQLNNIETERRFARESADRLLSQAKAVQTRVGQAMETVGLETLMEDIDVPSSFERDDAATTLSSLRDTVASSLTLEESLQKDLFDLRAARQRQSAQMWAVVIGLWCVAVVVFAPYVSISALLVSVATFVIATPRKIPTSEALRPSFFEHIGHCVALLRGKQQVMKHPFSLVEKGRTVSYSALGGTAVMSSITWVLLFIMRSPAVYNPIMSSPAVYNPADLLKHFLLVSILSLIAGYITFAVANHEITLPEMIEGEKNKVLK